MKNIMKKWVAVMLAVVFVIGLLPCEVRAESMVQIRLSGEANYEYAFEVLKLVKSKLVKLLQLPNILAILVTLEVSKLLKSKLVKLLQP